MLRYRYFGPVLCTGLAILILVDTAKPQARSKIPTRRLITQAVDPSRMVALPGNTRPEANAGNDRGPVPDDFPLQHMQLQLRLPAERQQALDQLIRNQQDPKSPDYHHWLTP